MIDAFNDVDTHVDCVVPAACFWMVGSRRLFRRRGALIVSMVGGAVVCALAGCSVPTTDGREASVVMGDRDAPSSQRVRVIRQVWESANDEMEDAETETVRESLKRLAWARSEPTSVRIAAIEELLEDRANEADTRNMLRLMLPTEVSAGVVAWVCDAAGDHGWRELSAALVRRWSEPMGDVSDRERVEAAALAAMYPDKDVADVVFDVFIGRSPGGALKERDRLAAWGLIRRLDPDNARIVALLGARGDDGDGDGDGNALVAVLRDAARDFHAVPDTAEQLAWVERLSAETHDEFRRECAGVISRLSQEQLDGFELRHAAGVRWAAAHRPAWLSASKKALMRELSERMKGRTHHFRTEAETVAHYRRKLLWGDALLALIAAEIVERGEISEAVFSAADKDQEDTSTEYGGVIDASGSASFVAVCYPPRPTQRFGDERFVASYDMLHAGDAALFHYHMQVQDHRHAAYAGPSGGDYAYAKTQGRACIVFTFIDAETINADYYQANGACIDVGDLRRPASR